MDKSITQDHKKSTGDRKSYQPPRIEIVPLLPKQTLLSGPCHTSSVSEGSNADGCMENFVKCMD